MAQDSVYIGFALAALQKAGGERVAKIMEVKVYNVCLSADLAPEVTDLAVRRVAAKDATLAVCSFCATGPARTITIAEMRDLQTQVANDHSIKFGDNKHRQKIAPH